MTTPIQRSNVINPECHGAPVSRKTGGVRTGVCGVDAFKVAISDGVETNLAQMDVIVLPLALLILGLIIRNPGLMIVPVCTIVATLMVEDLVM